MRFIFGVMIGAILMYLFDARQGSERREVWGERLRKGKDQAEHAVETGKHTLEEAKAKAKEATGSARSDFQSFRDGAEDAVTEVESAYEEATHDDPASQV